MHIADIPMLPDSSRRLARPLLISERLTDNLHASLSTNRLTIGSQHSQMNSLLNANHLYHTVEESYEKLVQSEA